MTTTKEETKLMIEALLEERRGYVMRDDKGGIEAVDKRLRELGAEGKAPAKRATKRAT